MRRTRRPRNERVLLFTKRSIESHVLDAFTSSGPPVTILREQPYVPVHRLRRYHAEQALAVVRAAKGFGSLVVLNAGAEVYFVALLMRLRPGLRRTRLVVADFLPSRHRAADLVQRWVLRRVDAWACIRRGDIEMLGRRYGVDRDRCTFVRFPLTFDPDDPDSFNADVSVDAPFYLYSAGDAHRDWGLVFDALELSPYPSVLSFRPDAAPEVEGRPPPPFALVYPRLKASAGRALAKDALLVIVALRDTDLAAGPSVLVDAMAVGATVVATDTNGTRDYLTDGETGRLVPPGDAAALAAVIDELVDDEEQCDRLGRAAAEWAAEHLQPEPFAQKVLALCVG